MIALLRRSLGLARDLVRSDAALRHAARAGAPGIAFGRYGRRVGARLLARRIREGASYLVCPVSIVRYFELPFALDGLPSADGDFLDVSSPRLFGFYVAETRTGSRVRMQNPHERDLASTRRMASALGLGNVETTLDGVDALADQPEAWDCIWSISVVEHIDGSIDDTAAVKLMYGALRPGGRLVITVPVDRAFRDEFRESDTYGTSVRRDDAGCVFFQRWYDEAALEARLVAPLEGAEVIRRGWFGEREPGRFTAYEQRWLREGRAATLDDPREIADHFQVWPSWDAMPGAGVAGLVIQKPVTPA